MKRRGALAVLLGIEREEPDPPVHGEIDLANGDVVRLDDGRPRLVEVLARLDGGMRVCSLTDGVNSDLVILDGMGGFWRFHESDEDLGGDLIAEAFHEHQMVAVRRAGERVTVTQPGCPALCADLSISPQLGATWLGSYVGPDGPGEQL